nr:MAG TPA: hypothetical protein [Caudoviricetes sp.]
MSASRREFNRFNHNINFKKGRKRRRAFFCPFFVRRTLFIERKGVGDMRVRLYSF